MATDKKKGIKKSNRLFVHNNNNNNNNNNMWVIGCGCGCRSGCRSGCEGVERGFG